MTKYSLAKLQRLAVVDRIKILRRMDLSAVSDKHVEWQVRSLLFVPKSTLFRVRPNRKVPCFINVRNDLWRPRPEFVGWGRCNEFGPIGPLNAAIT